MLFSNTLVALTMALTATAIPVEKRDGTCKFPSNKGLVAITEDKDNAGWAMSPDKKCTSGSFCPYACPPGKLMAQWDKDATSYSYPSSMNGGLKCGSDGELSKPFDDKDYCIDGKGTLSAVNNADKEVNFCQTVLPGDEDMLIPTNVSASSKNDLAVPGTDYYASTAAHYYINSPGVSTQDACRWGSKDKAEGNWAPYVAGANMNDDGSTFIKIGWNPKYIDDFQDKLPNFGIKVVCDDEDKCVGDCKIDPSKTGYNKIDGSSDDKSLNAAFCVVTANDKSSARIEVFDA